MKHLLRPYRCLGLALSLGLGIGITTAPPGTRAQGTEVGDLLRHLDPLLSHANAQGYLGVLVADVDSDAASRLKLKDNRGAMITLIDHDAPAGQMGLKVNDVVLAVNGQSVEHSEQFGKMLREIPAGHNVSLLISRDGNTQTVAVQLCDRKVMEHDVWNKMNSTDAYPPPTGMSILPGGGDGAMAGFHMPFFGSSLNVGAMVEPLTSQMADYLSIPSGVMVKQVTRKSEAAAAGLKPFDIVVKIGNDAIGTSADWDRNLRANQGKTVQVTVLRDRRQLVFNLQVDSKHRSTPAH